MRNLIVAFALLSWIPASEAVEWTREVVAAGAAKPSLAIGADGTPRVAYMLEATPGFVALAERRQDAWLAEQVASGYFYGPLDVLVLGERPVINFHDHDLQDQVVATREEAGWALTPVRSAGHDGWDNTLGVDPSGVLHTLTTDPLDFGGPGLEYASLVDGTWRVEEVGTGPIMYAEGLSLTFATDGTPHISYHNTPERSLYYGTRVDGAWRLTRVDSGPDAGMFSSVALTPEGAPRVSYVKLGSDGAEVRLASLSEGTWSSERIDLVPDLSVGFTRARNATALRVEPSGSLVVAYSSESSLKVARKERPDAGDWTLEIVDTMAANTGLRFGQQVDLERDPSGRWHLVTFVVLGEDPLSGDVLYYRENE